MALLIITLLFRYLPIIPIQRTTEENELLRSDKNTRL